MRGSPYEPWSKLHVCGRFATWFESALSFSSGLCFLTLLTLQVLRECQRLRNTGQEEEEGRKRSREGLVVWCVRLGTWLCCSTFRTHPTLQSVCHVCRRNLEENAQHPAQTKCIPSTVEGTFALRKWSCNWSGLIFWVFLQIGIGPLK